MATNDNDTNGPEIGSVGVDLDKGFRLDNVEVLPRQSAVVRDGERQRMERKAMDVLVCLARHAGETVTRQQFEDEVWRDRVVTPQNLDRAIFMVRKALGDSAREPHFVQNIPTVGYRLLTEVTPLEGPSVAVRPIWQRWAIAGGVALAVVLLGLALLVRDETILNGSAPVTISVQCFDNLSDQPDGEYFADGLADEIRTALSRLTGVRVISRTSSEAFCDSGLPISDIGDALGAGWVLEGSVRRVGDQVKIGVQLGDAADDKVLLSEDYSGALADIFELQESIARDVAGRLQVQLAPGEPLVIATTDDLEAYQLYLRAHFQLRRRGVGPLRRAIELFQRAIARDPAYGPAYQGLAEAFAVAPSYTGEESEQYVGDALAALDRAEALSGTDSHADAIRGLIHINRWQWEEAHEAFEGALAGEPDNSDLLQWHSQFLAGLGYVDRALDYARRSVKEDPLSPVAHQRLGVVLLWYDDLPGAAAEFRIASEELGLAPTANARSMFPLMLRQEQYAEAETFARRVFASAGSPIDWIDPWLAFVRGEGPADAAITALQAAYAVGTLDSRVYVGALYYLNDSDVLLDAIEQVRAAGRPLDHEVWFVQEGSILRGNPRFPTLLEEMGIIDYWDRHGWPPRCRRDGAQIACGEMLGEARVDLYSGA